MFYRDFQGLSLSALGMGCMRLPVTDGADARPDEAAAARMVDEALANGVNYFDTAWGYHGGNSETVLGRALASHPRESYYLADKFPGYDLSNMDKAETIFERQLEKTGAGYFDFYLFHNVCEMNVDAYLDPKHGILDYLLRQKAAGRIRHLGFSAHGALPVMERFLDAYGAHMEFCQIQLNWLDWEFQDARAKVGLLAARGLPVWVMEPLRGGRLCRLSGAETAALEAAAPGRSPTEWAFRFLEGVPGVTVILSGMSSEEQLRDNLSIFRTEAPLSPAETELLTGLARGMTAGVPCTACHYCVDHCPMGIDIPKMIALYNEHRFSGGGFLAPMALMAVPEENRPSACLSCGSCAAVCPQQIDIPSVMSDFAARLAR